MIGVDLAKSVFLGHGAAADGSAVFQVKLSRSQFTRIMAEQPSLPLSDGGLRHRASLPVSWTRRQERDQGTGDRT